MSITLGIDFDNTIAGYDHIFHAAAVQRGWLPAEPFLRKRAVRDRIRAGTLGDIGWQELQGEVYGRRMAEARPLPGCVDFLYECRRKRIDVVVVSHKTVRAARDPTNTDLRAAALDWMENQGLFDLHRSPLTLEKVYFENTRVEKIARIAQVGCTHFVDDLPEIFADGKFPPHTVKYLIGDSDPDGATVGHGTIRVADWRDVEDHLFG